MRVCMVLFGDLRYDYRVYREAVTLSQAGHQISLVASDFGGVLSAEWEAFDLHPIRIDRSASLRRTYPSFWRRAAKVATRLRADVYHAHDLDALWPAARAAKACDAVLVYDSHELFPDQSSLVERPWIRGFWRLLERRLMPRVDRLLTVSDTIASRLQHRYRLRHPATVVRNLPPFRKPLETGGLREALDLVGDPEPLALYQGGFLTDNGLKEQITAMQKVTTGRLVLLGSGPVEAELRQLVARAGLVDRVRFLARVPFPELHALTCGADLGLCIIKPTGSSFLWSMPNKLFEYLMAGLPVVAGDTPEIRRVVEAAAAGVLVDPLDSDDIASALNEMWADEDRRRQMSAKALEAARRYCWEEEAPRLLEIYQSL